MKKVLLFLLLIISGLAARANHVEGAYITYRQLSGNSYEVVLHATLGCYGPAPAGALTYELHHGSTVVTDTLWFDSERISTPLGNSCTTNCQTPGIAYLSKECLYKDTVDLGNISDCQIRLACSLVSRSGPLMGPVENMYVFTEFNRCLGVVNSSPVLKDLRQILHHNVSDYIFYEPVDSFDKRDSMSLSLLQTAYKSANTSIAYSGSYNAQRPFNYPGFPNTPLTFSNERGWIRVTASTINQIAYLAGDLYEWVDSAGVKVQASKIHFDHLILVANPASFTAVPQLSFMGGGAGANGVYDPCTDTAQFLDYVLSDSTDTLSYFIQADAPITYSVVDTNAGYKHIRISVNIPDSLVLDTFYVRIYAKDNNCILAKERNFLLPFVRFPKPSQFAAPQLDSMTLCNGYRLSLSDPAQQNLSFRFLNNKDTQSLYFQQAGYTNFLIRVTNGYNCYVDIQDSVHLGSFTQVQANVGHGSLADCPGTFVPFHISPSGGTGPYRVKWDNTDTNFLYLAQIPDAVLPDTFSLTLLVSDARGCMFRDTFLLINHQKPINDIVVVGGPGPVQCYANGPLMLHGAGTLGTPPFTFNWFTLGNQQVVTVDPANDTLIFLEVIDSNGCSILDSIQIIRYHGPVAAAGNDTAVCQGGQLTLKAGANPGMSASYSWLGIGSGATLSYYPSLSGHVHLKVSDSLGCLHYDSLYVTVYSKPDLTIGGPSVACEHETIQFTPNIAGGTAPFQYTWTGGPQSGASSVYGFAASQSTQVRCVLVDTNACRDTSVLQLTVFSFDTIAFQPGSLLYCEKQPSFSLVNWVNPKGGTWTGKGVRSNQFFPDSANPGNHTVYYTIGTGQCFDKDSLVFEVRPAPAIDFEADTLYGTAPLQVQFANKTQGNFTWFWDFGDPQRSDDTSGMKSPVFTYTTGGTFSPKLIADNGACRDSLKKNAYINLWHTGLKENVGGECRIYPNPFSAYLEMENSTGLPLSWQLYTIQGQLLDKGTLNPGTHRLEAEGLKPGFYLLRLNGVTTLVEKGG